MHVNYTVQLCKIKTTTSLMVQHDNGNTSRLLHVAKGCGHTNHQQLTDYVTHKQKHKQQFIIVNTFLAIALIRKLLVYYQYYFNFAVYVWCMPSSPCMSPLHQHVYVATCYSASLQMQLWCP